MNRKMLAVVLPVVVALLLVGVWMKSRRSAVDPGESIDLPAAESGEAGGTGSTASGELLDRDILAQAPQGSTYRVERYNDPDKGAIAGHILDRTGRGLFGVAVEIIPSSAVYQPTHFYSTAKVYSDKNGYFIFHNIDPQTYHFICGPVRETLPVKPGTMVIRDIQLKGAASVSGSVVDAEGIRIFPAVVYLVSPRFRMVCRTTETGTFEMQGVPADRYQVAARSDGYVPSEYKDLTLKETDRVTDMVFTLESGAGLVGHVRNEHQEPIPNVRISTTPSSGRIGTASAMTDRNGYFELAGIQSGRQQLTLMLDGSYERAGPAVNVEIGKRNYVEITLRSGSRVLGTVKTSSGEPVPEDLTAVVQRAAGAGKDQYFRRAVDPDGRFVLENLDEGEYKIFISSQDKKYVMPEPRAVKVSERSEQSVSFVIDRGGLLAGQVTDRAGTPVARARIVITCRTKAGRTSTQTAASNESGFFQSNGLPPGVVTLETASPGYLTNRKENVQLAAGASLNIAVILDKSGTIEGRVTDSQGRPRVGVTAYARPVGDASFSNLPKAITSADGRFSFTGLNEGRYMVYILWANPKANNRMQTMNQQVQVIPNQAVRADFRLPSP